MGNAALGSLFIAAAVFSDVLANVFIKKSKGFTHKLFGVIALAFVGVAFILLGHTLKYIDLSIAYSLFGAFGILLTTLVDKLFFGLRIKLMGVAGIITTIAGVILLKTL